MKAFLNDWLRLVVFSGLMIATMFSDGWQAVVFGFLTIPVFAWSHVVWYNRGWDRHAEFHNEMARQ
jgi:hypothetical protein